MAIYKGLVFALDGILVTAPDTDKWEPIVLGEDLQQLLKLSPFQNYRWHKRVYGPCTIDWKAYENRIMVSVTGRSHRANDCYATYADAIVQSIEYESARENATDITMTIRVNTESEV